MSLRLAKTVRVVIRQGRASNGFVRAAGEADEPDYYFAIPDPDQAADYKEGTDVVFVPVQKGPRRFADHIEIVKSERELIVDVSCTVHP